MTNEQIKAERLKDAIFTMLDNSGIEFDKLYEIKYLVIDFGSEKYKNGLNKGTEICKSIYQKNAK